MVKDIGKIVRESIEMQQFMFPSRGAVSHAQERFSGVID